ncbi:hypothetical protein [Streptomyces sp. NPDC096311]|uniref:hypothetical protein n=1 Tax=Streptomyces sp. NPDC096311 TaxID=3366083 RepID=UPI00381BA7A8
MPWAVTFNEYGDGEFRQLVDVDQPVPGAELAGIVAEAGKNAAEFAVGDEGIGFTRSSTP